MKVPLAIVIGIAHLRHEYYLTLAYGELYPGSRTILLPSAHWDVLQGWCPSSRDWSWSV